MRKLQDYSYCSPFFLKRWVHQKRFKEALRILDLRRSDTLLDYGCGDGHLLELCLELLPPENLYGFDPAEIMYQQAIEKLNNTGITLVENISDLPLKRFTKIACLETCEHLLDRDLGELLTNIERLFAANGEALISVPIEIGIPALIKNSFRLLNYKRYDNITLKNYFNTIFGLPTTRITDQKMSKVSYIYTHTGFDHRGFELLLSDHFVITSKQCSPVDFLGTLINHTIFYKCAKKQGSSGK